MKNDELLSDNYMFLVSLNSPYPIIGEPMHTPIDLLVAKIQWNFSPSYRELDEGL